METLDYWDLAVAVPLCKGGGEIRIKSSIKDFLTPVDQREKRQNKAQETEADRGVGKSQEQWTGSEEPFAL